ncbi:hypothetical protein ACIBG4_17830 [Nonomuraea sp. NPDC050383]|uniref:hypothetical protein n=1 Tax=Nonomuraea sp. NPDC050383 TaxID=3364362 RepID=UPI003787496A
MTQPIQRLNPASPHPTPGCSHVTLAGPGRTAHLAGQCPLDRTDAVVGEGDVIARTDQASSRPGSTAYGAPSSAIRSWWRWSCPTDRASSSPRDPSGRVTTARWSA